MKRALDHLKKSDPVLATIIRKVGKIPPRHMDPTFQTMVRSIAFQQLNGKAASTIFGRLVEAAGGTLTPESILALSPQRMRACGLSKQKLSYIRDLAATPRSSNT
jgi:DNA-3-methyladenine glycosylase II